jgi:hypothetical protein
MKTAEGNIEIKRKNGALCSISVIMPIWSKLLDDATISVDVPLFGLKTFVKSEEDVDVAVEEAIKCFCIASEKFGQGIEKELQTIGWTFENEKDDLLNFIIDSENSVFEQIMETGEQFAESDLQVAC